MKEETNKDFNPPEWMLWLDGALPADQRAEFERRMDTDAALRAEVEAALSMRKMLREAVPATRELPYPDFFNSQIQVRINREDEDRRARERALSLQGWNAWKLRLPWLVTTAAALVALMLLRPGTSTTSFDTVVSGVYAPDPLISVTDFYSAEAGAAVLVLEGIEEVPANVKVAGWQLPRGRYGRDLNTGAIAPVRENSSLTSLLKADQAKKPRG
jgi:anti-sigma-K factor RskA